MSTFKLIGLGGLAGSGKTTIAKNLWRVAAEEQVTGIVLSFATPLKRMLVEMLRADGWTEDQITQQMQVGKNEPIPQYGGQSLRYMMQTLGTEWGRNTIQASFWADMGERTMKRSRAGLVVFDDLRFATESAMIKRNGGMVVQLERAGTQRLNHASEGMEYTADKVWQNDGDPLDLARKIWADVQ